MNIFRVRVRHVREWTVYVETSQGFELAAELACDVPEDVLGEPDFEEVGADGAPDELPIDVDEAIPEDARRWPPMAPGDV